MNEIRELRQTGLSVSEISRVTGFDRKTVRKYLEEPLRSAGAGKRGPRGSLLDAFKEYLDQRLAAGVWNGAVLLRELRKRGYRGGYTLVKDYLQPRRAAARAVAVRRFETPPGQQAQVDWGSLGRLESADGTVLKLSGFALSLGHSRALFADLATDEQLPTLLRLHEAAFAALGGVPKEILYDHMRTVLLGYDERGEPRWHPVFLDFARHWGFTPRACRPRRPQTKGKIESGLKYLRGNFLPGRDASSLEDLRTQLREWLGNVANVRVHGTTHRVIQDAWGAERLHLQPVGERSPYPYVPEVTRTVTRDAYVHYGTSRYSVPWKLAGQPVRVRQVDHQVQLWHGGLLVAQHALSAQTYACHTVSAHHDGMPYGPAGPLRKKPQLDLKFGAPLPPDVQQRSLAAYDALIPGGL